MARRLSLLTGRAEVGDAIVGRRQFPRGGRRGRARLIRRQRRTVGCLLRRLRAVRPRNRARRLHRFEGFPLWRWEHGAQVTFTRPSPVTKAICSGSGGPQRSTFRAVIAVDRGTVPEVWWDFRPKHPGYSRSLLPSPHLDRAGDHPRPQVNSLWDAFTHASSMTRMSDRRVQGWAGEKDVRDEVGAALRPSRMEPRSPHRPLTLSPITCCGQRMARRRPQRATRDGGEGTLSTALFTSPGQGRQKGKKETGPVAQRLEQGTHNPLVGGSIPSGPTCKSLVSKYL